MPTNNNLPDLSLSINFLVSHLQALLAASAKIFIETRVILQNYPRCLHLIYDVLSSSIAGSMLSKILHALLLLRVNPIKKILFDLLEMLTTLNALNCLLPKDVNDGDNLPSTSNTPTLSDIVEDSWVWIIDMERTCSLLIGQNLGNMLTGYPVSNFEFESRYWLKNKLFSHGK